MDKVVSLVVSFNLFVGVTVKKSSSGWSKKFADFAFETNNTFSVPNGGI